MLDFLGGIFSGAMDLFGQSQNISAQQQMAQQNIQEQNFLASGGNLPSLVTNAKKAGINPLAALGYSGGTAPSNSISGAGSGTAAAGQDISRALSAMTDHQQKQQQMQTELISAQADKLRSEATANYDNVMARHLGATGSPPSAQPGQGFAPSSSHRNFYGRQRFGARIHPAPLFTYNRDPAGNIWLTPTEKGSQQTMTRLATGPATFGGAQSLAPVAGPFYENSASVPPWLDRFLSNQGIPGP